MRCGRVDSYGGRTRQLTTEASTAVSQTRRIVSSRRRSTARPVTIEDAIVMNTPVVDTHAHTWSDQFNGDYAETMERAWAAGLMAVVEVGTDSETSLRALTLAQADERIHAVAGLHPHSAKRLKEERDALRLLLERGEFVAVGEIGLDFYRNLATREEQYEALRWQLDLARDFSLPIVIHARNADEQCFQELSKWVRRVGRYLGAERELGMLHCFAGDINLARRYVELGFLISVPSTVTYTNNTRLREVARLLSLDAMLVETDCPMLPPAPHRSKRNEPAYVVLAVQEMAQLRCCRPEEIAAATTANAKRLFGFATLS